MLAIVHRFPYKYDLNSIILKMKPTSLWSSSVPGTSYPIAFGLNIYPQSQSFTNVTITGAPLIALSGNSTQLAPLPWDRDFQLTAPITITGEGAGITALSGDQTTDAAATLSEIDDSSSELIVRVPHAELLVRETIS